MVFVNAVLELALGRSKVVRLVSLNKLQAVLSQICNYSPLSVNAALELARFYLN